MQNQRAAWRVSRWRCARAAWAAEPDRGEVLAPSETTAPGTSCMNSLNPHNNPWHLGTVTGPILLMGKLRHGGFIPCSRSQKQLVKSGFGFFFFNSSFIEIKFT